MANGGADTTRAARAWPLVCKQLTWIAERFEFQGIARRVQEKHGRLLPGLTLETNVGLDHKCDARCLDLLGENMEFIPVQHHAKVGHRHVVTIHRVVMLLDFFRGEMGDDLMTEQVEIDPLFTGPSFGAAQHCAVKVPCLV
jgi:hypothetical protein